MPLPLTVSCFSKIQIGFTFLVPANPGSPGQRAVKRVCVCCLCYLTDPGCQEGLGPEQVNDAVGQPCTGRHEVVLGEVRLVDGADQYKLLVDSDPVLGHWLVEWRQQWSAQWTLRVLTGVVGGRQPSQAGVGDWQVGQPTTVPLHTYT